jgi:hypothetical protein
LRQGMSSYRPIRWEGARTAASGLVVAFFSGRDPLDVDHDEPDRYQYEVTETRSGVGVTVIEESRPGDVGGGLGYMRALDVDLSSPLGQRILTDESSGETREAFDERRLLRSPTQSAWKAVTEGGSQWEWTTTYVNEWRLSTAAYIDVTIRGGIRAELNPELDYDESGQLTLRGGNTGVWGLESRSHRHLRLSWKEDDDIVAVAADRNIGLDSVLAFAESLQRR